METKVCTKCKEEKGVGEFRSDKRNKNGLQSACAVCQDVASKESRLKSSEKLKEYKRSYYLKNKEKLDRQSRKWATDNPEKVKLRVYKWRDNNKNRYKEITKNWQTKNWESVYEKQKEYKRNNSQKTSEQVRSRIQRLSDGYVSGKLKDLSLPITPETIELKRTQIKIKRIIKTLENEQSEQ